MSRYNSWGIAMLIMIALLHTKYVKAQQYNYAKEMEKFSSLIDDQFFLKSINYYKEHAEKNGQQERKVSFLWPLCALFEAKKEAGIVLDDYKQAQQIFAIIQKYKSSKPPATGYESYPTEFGGGTRFYDDNQWIGITAMDLYQSTMDTKWLAVGKEIYTFMMTGYDTINGGGLYWEEGNKKTKHTCSNGPGIILALQLYSATKNHTYLKVALSLYNWANLHLKDSIDGLYFDNINVHNGKVDKKKYSYNAGTMMQSAIYLYELTGNDEYLTQAKEMAKNTSSLFLSSGKMQDNYWFYAVLMRAYQHLFAYDKNAMYLKQFAAIVANALQTDRSDKGFVGKRKVHNLVPQGGMLEMLARLALLQKANVIH